MPRIQKHVPFVLLAFCAANPLSAAAEDQAARSLAANCTSCHGPNGSSAGGIPSIAGLEKGYIVTVLHEFQSGKRPATVMHQHAKGYTDLEFDTLAEYFSRQKP